MANQALSQAIKAKALQLGFDHAGITRLTDSEHSAFYRSWVAAGRHGSMAYLARADAVARRGQPTVHWPELRSAIIVAQNYYNSTADDVSDPSRGIVARYARGRDYHKVMKKKLLRFLEWLEAETGQRLPAARAYVDTGPVLERELARRAGLGWFGRNTMLVNPRAGSYFFLGSLLVELELEPDAAFTQDHCGTCDACVQSCPTAALLGRDETGAPVIDAPRCISYLTIENRGPIPRDLRPLIGNRIYGCDICQEACPFSRKFSRITSEPAFAARAPNTAPFGVESFASDGEHPGTASPSLIALMSLDGAGWEAFSRGSPIRRAGREGFLRNVAVALGNWGSDEAVPVLAAALRDPHPLVRGHSVWALKRIGSAAAVCAVEVLVLSEKDPFVIEELHATPSLPRRSLPIIPGGVERQRRKGMMLRTESAGRPESSTVEGCVTAVDRGPYRE